MLDLGPIESRLRRAEYARRSRSAAARNLS